MSSNQNNRELALAHAVNLATRGDSPDIGDADSILVAAEKFSNFISDGALPASEKVAEKPALTPGQLLQEHYSADRLPAGIEILPAHQLSEAARAYANHSQSCPGCTEMDKDLKTAGFPGLLTRIEDVKDLGAEARAELTKLGFTYFGEILTKGPLVRFAFDEGAALDQLDELMLPVSEFLQARFSPDYTAEPAASEAKAANTDYGQLALHSFSNLGPEILQALNNAGYNTIGEVTDNADKVLTVLATVEPLQSINLVGHIVTNLRHLMDDQGHTLSPEARERGLTQIKKLENLVRGAQRVLSLLPSGQQKPELSPGGEKLMGLLTGAINLGGGRFAVNAADPEINAALQDLLGSDGMKFNVGGAEVEITGKTMTEADLDQLEPGLRDTLKSLINANPGNQTKH